MTGSQRGQRKARKSAECEGQLTNSDYGHNKNESNKLGEAAAASQVDATCDAYAMDAFRRPMVNAAE